MFKKINAQNLYTQSNHFYIKVIEVFNLYASKVLSNVLNLRSIGNYKYKKEYKRGLLCGLGIDIDAFCL